MPSVYITVSSKKMNDRINDLTDSGELKEAQDLNYFIKSIAEKLKSEVSIYGGQLLLATDSKFILNVPENRAEDCVNTISSFLEEHDNMIGIGVGFNTDESGQASLISERTGQVELYGEDEKLGKNMNFDLPVNTFDPTAVKPKLETERNNTNETLAMKRMSADESNTGQSKLIQSIIQQLSPQASASPQQQPQNLLEALSGRVSNKARSAQMQQAQAQQAQAQQAEQTQKEEIPSFKESEPEVDEVLSHNSRLGVLLGTIKSSLPEIMKLHDTNPQAFNHSMSLIKQLLSLVKEKRESSKK